jgi:hypothetical protein
MIDARGTPQEATLPIVCLATPRAGTPLIFPSPPPPGAEFSNYPSRYRRIITQTEQEMDIAATEQPYHRWQGQLKLWIC